LHVDVGAADQGACNSIPFIRQAGMHQDAAKNARIKAKGPRCVDDSQELGDGVFPVPVIQVVQLRRIGKHARSAETVLVY
jgi:hypothetical protein